MEWSPGWFQAFGFKCNLYRYKLVSLEPARLGHELTRRWQKFRDESAKMTNARWQAMGPEPPAPLGCRYVESTRTNQGGLMTSFGAAGAREIERDPNWSFEKDSAPVINSRNTQ
jgi:hypothetical protein